MITPSLELWKSPQIHNLMKTQYYHPVLMEPKSEKLTCKIKPNRRSFQWRLLQKAPIFETLRGCYYGSAALHKLHGSIKESSNNM